MNLKEDELYQYDGLFRLTNSERGDLNGSYSSISNRQLEQDWSLDGQGNWSEFKERDSGASWDIDQDRAHNNANEAGAITGTGNWYDPQHDDAGNITRGPKPSSPTIHQEYVYDAWNRLVTVKNNTGATVAEYEYDGLNRRIVKTMGSVDEHFYYNANYQVIEVRPDTGATTDPSEQYVWHPHYIDALAVRFVDDNSDGDFADPSEEQFACFDGNFNVSLLIGNQGVVQRYRYTAYGEIRAFDGKTADFNLDGVVDISDFNIWNGNNGSAGDHSDGDANGDGSVDVSDFNAFNGQNGSSESLVSEITNPYTYTGRRFDRESGLYYYRARYYDAKLGRFLSRDPIEFEGSEWSLYEYTGSSPTGRVDPEGTIWLQVLGTYKDEIADATGNVLDALGANEDSVDTLQDLIRDPLNTLDENSSLPDSRKNGLDPFGSRVCECALLAGFASTFSTTCTVSLITGSGSPTPPCCATAGSLWGLMARCKDPKTFTPAEKALAVLARNTSLACLAKTGVKSVKDVFGGL